MYILAQGNLRWKNHHDAPSVASDKVLQHKHFPKWGNVGVLPNPFRPVRILPYFTLTSSLTIDFMPVRI